MPGLSTTFSGELDGIHARLVEVEVDLHVGLHSFTIVGLGDKAVGEAKERVNSALKNSGFKSPNRENRRITVNLAPAIWRKTGAQYDLAIAIAYLAATRQIAWRPDRRTLLVGELALDGRVRPIRGALSIVAMAKENGFGTVVIPEAHANEVKNFQDINVITASTLREALRTLEGANSVRTRIISQLRKAAAQSFASREIALATPPQQFPDFAIIKDQPVAKRTLMIAATGFHNVLMSGPPGVGKSTLARAFLGILPPLSDGERMEVAQIKSAVGERADVNPTPPFRAPHHSTPLIAMIGGGSPLIPGEITRAHRGVLFLDELTEFSPAVLESLREPLEMGEIHVVRMRERLTLPSQFLLIAAMNPCRCGFYGDGERRCRCTFAALTQYRKKLSGPLLDRIDIHISLSRVPIETLHTNEMVAQQINSETNLMREHVIRARNFRKERAHVEQHTAPQDIQTLFTPHSLPHVSPRGYAQIMRIARTIADLEMSPVITRVHLNEALQYRYRENR